ncbi:MAG: CBS domain-containing protein [Candidatus Thermoplasmatota archaeon]|nr:CBS domain-containing protein [Candidatus Thermoplasmatota archaeon]
MLVKEIMTKKVVTIHSDDTVFDACLKYRDEKVGCLVVIENEFCVGIVTERDLIERTLCMRKNPETTKVSEIMSSDIKTIYALDKVETAIDVMQKHKIKKLPVIADDKIVGIITVTDISKARPDISKRFMESWMKPQWKD